MKKFKLNNQGVILPIIIIVMAVSMILVLSIFNLTSNQTKMTSNYVGREKALQYAEAGFNKYLWHLNDDVNYYNIETSDVKSRDENVVKYKETKYEDGYYQVDVTIPSQEKRFVTITSIGWSALNPDIKRTIKVEIRKKQFVHHVYVSDREKYLVGYYGKKPVYEEVWWSSNDEVHGPLHTNGRLNIEGRPIFYDTVTYSSNEGIMIGSGYNPVYKYPLNKNSNIENPKRIDKLEFPETNKELKYWAQKDDMVFKGRTCIYINGDELRIRNQNNSTKYFSIKDDLDNKVIYIENADGYTGTDKWDLRTGNLFISGTLKGQLTIAAQNNIYITFQDPTDWKEPDSSPNKGGIKYSTTKFGDPLNPNELSFYDEEKGMYVRKVNKGKDMLGLVANNDIKILHYGWPRDPGEGYGNYYEVRQNLLHRKRTYMGWEYYREWNPKEPGYWEHFRKLEPGERYYDIKYNNISWKKIKEEDIYYDVAPKNITIHAALIALNGGFGFENYNKGKEKENINLWGSITQKERKAVKQGRHGYDKKYAHDPRMFYDYPPHILEPVNVGWEVKEWKEIK